MTARNMHSKPARETVPHPELSTDNDKLQLLQLQCIIDAKDREIELLRQRLSSPENDEASRALEDEVNRLRGEVQRLAEQNFALRSPANSIAATAPTGRSGTSSSRPSNGGAGASTRGVAAEGAGVPDSAGGHGQDAESALVPAATGSGGGGRIADASAPIGSAPASVGGSTGASTGTGTGGKPAAAPAASIDPGSLVEKLRGLVSGLVAEAMAGREAQLGQQPRPPPPLQQQQAHALQAQQQQQQSQHRQQSQSQQPTSPGLRTYARQPEPCPELPMPPEPGQCQYAHIPAAGAPASVSLPAVGQAGSQYMPAAFPALPGLHITLQPFLPQHLPQTSLLAAAPLVLQPVSAPVAGCGAVVPLATQQPPAGAGGTGTGPGNSATPWGEPTPGTALVPHASALSWSAAPCSSAASGLGTGCGTGGGGWGTGQLPTAGAGPHGGAAFPASSTPAAPLVLELNVDGTVLLVERAALESPAVRGTHLYDMLVRRYGELPRDSQGRPYLAYNPRVFQVLLSVLKERWLFGGAAAAALDAGRDWAAVAGACGVSPGYLAQAAAHFGLQDVVDSLRPAATPSSGAAAAPAAAAPSAPCPGPGPRPQQPSGLGAALPADPRVPVPLPEGSATAPAGHAQQPQPPTAPQQLQSAPPPPLPQGQAHKLTQKPVGPAAALAPSAAAADASAAGPPLDAAAARPQPVASVAAAASLPSAGHQLGIAVPAVPPGLPSNEISRPICQPSASDVSASRVEGEAAPAPSHPDVDRSTAAQLTSAAGAAIGQPPPQWAVKGADPRVTAAAPGADPAYPAAPAPVASGAYRMPSLYGLLAQRQREDGESEREAER